MPKTDILITGSLAYDHVMTYPGRFSDHILPDQIHQLNVSFNLKSLDTDLGGTAGNIAYNLALLGEKPVIHATAGSDFGPYLEKLKARHLPTSSIRIFNDIKTAQAFVITDTADNQITPFFGGAMDRAHEHPLRDVQWPMPDVQLPLVIISPNDPKAMLAHAEFCRENHWRFLFDPGQTFNALTGDELKKACQNSLALTVNDYEWQLWMDKTGLDEKKTLELTQAIVITLGEKGSKIITSDKTIEVPAIPNLKVADPTGCGDAYRAGLLKGLSEGEGWEASAKIGTEMAAACVQSQGPQNHRLR